MKGEEGGKGNGVGFIFSLVGYLPTLPFIFIQKVQNRQSSKPSHCTDQQPEIQLGLAHEVLIKQNCHQKHDNKNEQGKVGAFHFFWKIVLNNKNNNPQANQAGRVKKERKTS